jgi:hypothetical protein
MRLDEVFRARLLYHTTANATAVEILSQRLLKASRLYDLTPLISFSEKPLIGFPDIGASDVSIGFHPYAFWGRIEQVIYSEQWYAANQEKASYIAGPGWREQFVEPEPEDEWDDDDNREYEYAELTAFLDKANEREWISREAYHDLKFNDHDVAVLIVKDDLDDWRRELVELGYPQVKVVKFR